MQRATPTPHRLKHQCEGREYVHMFRGQMRRTARCMRITHACYAGGRECVKRRRIRTRNLSVHRRRLVESERECGEPLRQPRICARSGQYNKSASSAPRIEHGMQNRVQMRSQLPPANAAYSEANVRVTAPMRAVRESEGATSSCATAHECVPCGTAGTKRARRIRACKPC